MKLIKKEPKKVYIAGPMSGIKEDNHPAFYKIEEKLKFIKNIEIGVLSPVLGLHAGPGSLAVCFKGKSRDMVFNV